MQTSKDSEPKVFLVEKAMKDLDMSDEIFLDHIEELKIFLMLDPLDNVEIYLIESDRNDSRNPQIKFRHPILDVTQNIDFLCVSPNEFRFAVHAGHHKQSKFHAIALFDKDKTKINIVKPHEYDHGRKNEIPMLAYLFGSFVTTKRINKSETYLSDGITESRLSLTIKATELFILAKDLQAIRGKIIQDPKNYGKFEPKEWTSSKLADLNEASHYFFSKNDSTSKDSASTNIESIREWFRKKWGDEPSDVLIDQAARSIQPDHLYDAAPPRDKVCEEIKAKYNDYASTTLIIINEIAEKYWHEMVKNNRTKYATRDTIKAESTLIGNPWKLTARMAGAVASIITLNCKQKPR